jgi:hypothetical protein
MEDAYYGAKIFTIVIGSISSIFPLSVVLILLQRYDKLVRGKSFIHYVLMIAIADFIQAVTVCFGYVKAGALCSTMIFISMFAARMSWFYTDVLIFQLFHVVVFKRFFLNTRYMDLLVWTLNITLQLLPYSTGTTYGRDDDKGAPVFVCTYQGTSKDVALWNEYAFSIELIISFAIIIILSIGIVFYSLNMTTDKLSGEYFTARIRTSWSIVILYPLTMLIAWLPSQIFQFYLGYLRSSGTTLPENSIVILDYLIGCNALNGPLLALIFYTKTQDARKAWMSNLRYFLYPADVEVDDRSTCSSNISTDDSEVTSSGQAISKLIRSSLRLWKGDTNSLTEPFNVQHEENPMTNDNTVRISESL